MKKFLCLLLTCCLGTICIGCNDNDKPADELTKTESATVAEKHTEKSDEKRNRKVDSENTNVYDESLILTDSEYDDLNSYASWLAQSYKINCAIVLTEDIGESSPADYAKNYYENHYNGDGILFLINNDTNNDYLYRRGVPAKILSDSTVQMLFAEISPMLALEEYSAAAGRILEAAEETLPQYFTDRTGELEAEAITELNQIITEKASDGNLNVYYIKGTGEDKLEDFAKKRFESFYDKDADAAMLVIDGEKGSSYLCLSGNMEYLAESRLNIAKAVSSCYDKEKGMDIKEAINKFIGFVE